MVTPEEIRRRIGAGYYLPTGGFPRERNTNEGREEARLWHAEKRQREQVLFRDEALAAAGLSNHPRRQQIFELAYEIGHPGGLPDTFSQLLQIGSIFSPCMRQSDFSRELDALGVQDVAAAGVIELVGRAGVVWKSEEDG